MTELINKRRGMLLLALLAAIIYFPVFLHLSYMPFRLWDESVVGVNAIQMMHNHNYIVTYFYESPDMYRCKPPLLLWCIILSSKILGFNELSLRLPSAIAAAVLCLYLFLMLKKITGNYLYGFLVLCILVTCQGYVGIHVERTGEYESLWILFSTVFSISLFMAVEADDCKPQSQYLLLFFIFLTLGVLTKGIACLLQQLPGLFIYVLVRKKATTLLANKAFYGGLAIFMLFGAGYYFLREYMTPGYLKAVLHHELAIQTSSINNDLELEGPFVRRYPFLFFIKRMVSYQFVYYIFIFPLALYSGLKLAEPRIRNIVRFSAIIGFTLFMIISFWGKKMAHYDGALFPYLAIITGSFFYTIYVFFSGWLGRFIKSMAAPVLASLCVLALLAFPYFEIIKTVYFPTDTWGQRLSTSCKFFQKVAKDEQEVVPYKLVYDDHPDYSSAMVLTCYKEELAEHGTDLNFVLPQHLEVNDKAVVFDSISKQVIAHDYLVDTLKHLDYCNADVLYVKGKR